MISCAENVSLHFHITLISVVSKGKHPPEKDLHVTVTIDARKLSQFLIFILAIFPAVLPTYIYHL